MIIKKDGRPNSFEQESTFFNAIDEKVTDKIFEIYAPIEYLNKRDKSDKIEKIKEKVLGYFSALQEA